MPGLHRLDRDRQAFHGIFRPVEPETGLWPETGGKSPNIVFADCEDLDAAADMAAFGIFFNQGEVCSANSRLYVQASIRDRFLEKLVARAQAMQPGDPLDPDAKMGAIVDEKQTQGIMRFVEAGKQSARLVTGGARVTVDGKGCFVQPTIFADVAQDDPLARDEIFGPVLSVIAFDSEDQAVAMANDFDLWSCSLGLDRQSVAGLPRGGPAACRHGLGQHGRRAFGADPLRRHEAVRFRPRSVAAFAGKIHGAEDRLDQIPGLTAPQGAPPRTQPLGDEIARSPL
ncbi:MAG: aldehyde dehydrogenase family protein [Nitrospira sp.]